jgi:hypothetical protein
MDCESALSIEFEDEFTNISLRFSLYPVMFIRNEFEQVSISACACFIEIIFQTQMLECLQ